MKQPSFFENERIDDLFYHLVQEYGEELTRLAYLYVKDKNISEDIIQDVFMRAFERIDQFAGKSSYKTYLYRMTINRCHDYFRSWSYKNTVLTEKVSHVFQSKEETESAVLLKQDKEFIFTIVTSLPIKYREVIILYYYHEFSNEEIAQLLKCSINTVKTRLCRGRLRLKKKLAIYDQEGGLEHG
ncbi:sigma-70 family RNA polymerase sigma factor [Paracerasibacillus soli]|uniref:Sigma-70 family RNA polymerase sigma factor n=1 Tax=Paracerasibacillus soli TaxID=480284 RepID=A0ABU5CPC4_9BACI|nr:sigma-70 family RNA polymerase sigma factor [Virgibacillus soli]MDY0408189.1 sigma-70 family RNA polymerase sigma factor [Virgibacillus soli]